VPAGPRPGGHTMLQRVRQAREDAGSTPPTGGR
jgi:hypothetical protein